MYKLWLQLDDDHGRLFVRQPIPGHLDFHFHSTGVMTGVEPDRVIINNPYEMSVRDMDVLLELIIGRCTALKWEHGVRKADTARGWINRLKDLGIGRIGGGEEE